jgi:hypothetical protein
MPVERRSPSSKQTQEAGKDMRLGNLTTLEDVQKLRTALHAKAKEEPEFRFYVLYDKIHRRDVLLEAYKSCKANGGAAGVDGNTFEDIKAYGEERWLGELTERLRKKVLGWKKLGHARRWSAHIVNYADDYVICCKGQAEEAMTAMRGMMERLKLTINEDKTHVCRLPSATSMTFSPLHEVACSVFTTTWVKPPSPRCNSLRHL